MQSIAPAPPPANQTVRLPSATRGDLELHRFEPANATDSLKPFLESAEPLGFTNDSPFLNAARKALENLSAYEHARRSVDQALQRFYESQLKLGEQDCPILASGSFSEGMKLRITPKDQGTLALMLGGLAAEYLRCTGDSISFATAKKAMPELAAGLEAAAKTDSLQGADLDFVHGVLANLGQVEAKLSQNVRVENVKRALSAWSGAASTKNEVEDSGVAMPEYLTERRYNAERAVMHFDRTKLLAKICEVEFGIKPEEVEKLTKTQALLLKVANHVAGIGLPIGAVAGLFMKGFGAPIAAACLSAAAYAAFGVAKWQLWKVAKAENSGMSAIQQELQNDEALLRRAREYLPYAREFSVDP